MISIILSIISLLGTLLVIWAIGRLNKYIATLEQIVEEQISRTDQLEDLLRESNIKQKKVVKKNLIPDDEE
jgi:hypothetical protein